jgi:hypothetical protein
MRPLALLLLSSSLSTPALADIAYDNFGPNNAFTGNGFLVRGPNAGIWWTHAFPITPTRSGSITTITVALQHLSGLNGYTFELRADAGGTPGPTIAVLGSVTGFTSGSTPVQFSANPGISISSGTPYWIFARGEGNATGTWLGSPTGGGFRAFSLDGGATFVVEPIPSNLGQGAIRIEVAGSCYPNCDNSSSTPLLTANDFLCFLNKFANNDPYANCDGSTGIPSLTSNDFQCFLNKFAAGCT